MTRDLHDPPAGPRYLASLHLDQTALEHLTAAASPAPVDRGCCTVAPGEHHTHATPIPFASARRMLCDAAIETTIHDADHHPLIAGRTTRTVNRRPRRELHRRDRGCRFPGCTHHGWLDAHHIPTGSTAAPPTSTTSCSCADATTASSTRTAGPSSATPAANSPSTSPTAPNSRSADPSGTRPTSTADTSAPPPTAAANGPAAPSTSATSSPPTSTTNS